MRTLKAGDVIQLERRGYYIVDRAAHGDEPVVLIDIPSGKGK
jgi:glutamyl-tRNA synthetase